MGDPEDPLVRPPAEIDHQRHKQQHEVPRHPWLLVDLGDDAAARGALAAGVHAGRGPEAGAVLAPGHGRRPYTRFRASPAAHVLPTTNKTAVVVTRRYRRAGRGTPPPRPPAGAGASGWGWCGSRRQGARR